MNLDEAYADARQRFVDLVQGLSDEQRSTRVVACPDWTVKDLTAHLTSVCALFVEVGHPMQEDGKIDFDLTDPARAKRMNDATGEQVRLRKGIDLDGVLAEWDGVLPRALGVLAGREPLPEGSPPTVKFAVVGDIAIHLQDARGALGLPGDRAIPAAVIAYESWLMLLHRRITAAGLPALRVRDRVIGEPDPGAVMAAEWFEALRALSGRRSREQMRAMFVEGDPDPYLPLLTTFAPPAQPIVEA